MRDRRGQTAAVARPLDGTITRAADGGRGGLLALQRLAGNRAVAQLVNSVQRDAYPHGKETGPALDEIHAIRESRARGEKIEPGRIDKAKLKAVAAGQHVVSTAAHAGGNEVLAAITELQRNLKDIKDARYRGYQDALAFLTLKQFDDDRSAGAQKSFLLALAGNLLWALSGLIAITPVGMEARLTASLLGAWGKGANVAPLVSKLMQVYAGRQARLATLAGTAGAMIAQFANGLPDMGQPGSNVSTSLIDAKGQFDSINAMLFADLDLMLYDLILVPLDGFQPGKTKDATDLTTELITITRGVAFAGYAESGRIDTNDGRIDETGIAQDSRNSLLRTWLASASGIRGGHLAATTTTEGGTGNKAGAKLVTSAVDLIGGEQQAGFGPYDLVAPKVRQAATTFGMQVAIDDQTFRTTLQQTLGAGKTLTLGSLGFDKKALTPEKLLWLNDAHALEWESLDTSGTVPPIVGIDAMVIEPADLSSMTMNKQKIFSLKKVTFQCRVDYGGSENPSRFQKTTLEFHLDSPTDTAGRAPVGGLN